MSRPPRISVCMTAYKHERYVGAAIDSILQQTFGDFELLIADDCSPDATYDIARSYTDPRISAQRMAKRSGPSATLNAALRRARGEYIALCSSDDRWLPEKLARQLDYMSQHPQAGAVFCRPWLIGENGERLPDHAHWLGNDFGGEKLSHTEWLARLYFSGNWLCAITPMLRASAVREVGEFHPLMLQLQDYDYWVRLFLRWQPAYLPERLAEYRVDTQGLALSSAATPEAIARTAYECYHVLRHFASGKGAEAIAAVPLGPERLLAWEPASPSRDLHIAEHALQCAQHLPPHSAQAHFLFALDRFQAHGLTEGGLAGAPAEERLFSLPFFEITGSSLAQNLFLGRMESGPPPAQTGSAGNAAAAEQPGFWRRMFGGGS